MTSSSSYLDASIWPELVAKSIGYGAFQANTETARTLAGPGAFYERLNKPLDCHMITSIWYFYQYQYCSLGHQNKNLYDLL